MLFAFSFWVLPQFSWTAGISGAPDQALVRLRNALDRLFSHPDFREAQWGVEVYSLSRGETIYTRNATRLMIPASNNKLITAGVALLRLGPDYHYETRVATDGRIEGSVLKGNLLITAAGDPSLAARFQSGDPMGVFKEWAIQLKAKGICSIEGNILGDGGLFEEKMLGRGWEWDDLPSGFAAPVSAFQFNENQVLVEAIPAETEGSPAHLKMAPLENYLTLDNRIITSGTRTDSDVEIARGNGRESFILRGSIPLKNRPIIRTIAVQSPTDYYLQGLKQVLEREGINVSACSIGPVRESNGTPLALLCSHTSPPLSEIIKPLLKTSQNLYAETLIKTLGLVFRKQGSFSAGKDVVEETLGGMGIEKGTYFYADGSGLSRLNLVSASQLTSVLRFMSKHDYFPFFFDSLPIAGVDGTIAGRLKGTSAENNVRAKTGSVANVRTLSGYVETAGGEMLAYSMLANNYLAPGNKAEALQDSALVLLARFNRARK